MESAILYYNLGNCYYKLGENTQAILNYERALLLDPSDASARYNLKMAQQAIVDKIEVLPELFLVRWYKGFVGYFSAVRETVPIQLRNWEHISRTYVPQRFCNAIVLCIHRVLQGRCSTVPTLPRIDNVLLRITRLSFPIYLLACSVRSLLFSF